ncbi:MAG: hypothetical protein M0Z31_10650 [Clostridia bacterium]|nr:hypothetical protein [Clostridia bacterium]
MRRIYIVFGIIFTLLTNFVVTGVLYGAKPVVAGVLKEELPPGSEISLKEVVNIILRGVEQGEALFTLNKPDFQKEMAVLVDFYNGMQPYEGKTRELHYPQVVDFELAEGEPVVVKGEIFTAEDYFVVEQGNVKRVMESEELKSYLRTFLMALVPDLAFKDVVLVNAGEKENVVFGSKEMDELTPKLNEVVKPIIIAPKGVKASITKEGLQEEIKTNAGLKYIDALLYRPVQVKGANAARVLVILNGAYQNFVVYTDGGYNILDAQKVEGITEF